MFLNILLTFSFAVRCAVFVELQIPVVAGTKGSGSWLLRDHVTPQRLALGSVSLSSFQGHVTGGLAKRPRIHFSAEYVIDQSSRWSETG